MPFPIARRPWISGPAVILRSWEASNEYLVAKTLRLWEPCASLSGCAGNPATATERLQPMHNATEYRRNSIPVFVLIDAKHPLSRNMTRWACCRTARDRRLVAPCRVLVKTPPS
jgi:hypothetical protein